MVEAAAPRLIFDPGISSEWDLVEDILAAIGVKAERPKSVTKGAIRVNGFSIVLNVILFDSGAIHRSYVSEELVNEHREILGSNLSVARSVVRLADQQTTKESKEELEAEIEVNTDNNNTQAAKLNMVVWSMPGIDLIIGLPDIVQYFKETFFDMLTNISDSMELEPGQVVEWSNGEQLESEEEANTEVPCSFTEALNFMEVSYEEALKVYEESLDKHVGEMLSSSSRLREILNSDTAKTVFVPPVTCRVTLWRCSKISNSGQSPSLTTYCY